MQSAFVLPQVFIKIDGYKLKLNLIDIVFLKACDKYVEVVTTGKTYTIRATLTEVEEGLFPQLFCRVHRSYIVNLHHVCEVHSDYLVLGKVTIPLHANYYSSFDKKAPTLN